MDKITLILLLVFVNTTFAQNEMMTTKGIISFDASIPLYEENKGINETVYCVLNTKTGEIKSTVLIKDFHFKFSLMEEHFNQKYLESNHYPKAFFRGIIQDFDWNSIGTSPKECKIKGRLEIHGKKKEISTIVLLKKVDQGLSISSYFNINVKDFDIDIPILLRIKIDETVGVQTTYLVK
jgi:hypothetical protein